MVDRDLPKGFLDARTQDNDRVVQCDVCIVGTGAAGVTAALGFGDSKHKVCVLEGGGLEPDPVSTSQYEVDVADLPIGPEARQRYFGGSTNTWGGGLAMPHEIDFGPRPWLPMSSWPIQRIELASYYRGACDLFGVDQMVFDVSSLSQRRGKLLQTKALDTALLFWPKRAMRFGHLYLRKALRNPRISTYLHANVTDILLDEWGRRVDRVVVQAFNGRRFFIHPRVMIVAVGGIENARMLLLCRSQRSKGIGNEFDQVGRYYMDHPKGVCGSVRVPAGLRRLPHPAYWWGRRGNVRLGIRLSEGEQARHGVLNSYLRLRLVFDRPAWLPNAAPLAWARVANRARLRKILIKNFMEQEPRPQNRVCLSDKRDLFGAPMARLEWSISELERRTMRELHAAVDQELRRRSFGRVDSPLLSGSSDDWSINQDASHHIGTTRMGTDPKTSVVDRHCRVHGVDNLYVAGSSVFPSSGYANPTLTIVALALRLADHVKQTTLA